MLINIWFEDFQTSPPFMQLGNLRLTPGIYWNFVKKNSKIFHYLLNYFRYFKYLLVKSFTFENFIFDYFKECFYRVFFYKIYAVIKCANKSFIYFLSKDILQVYRSRIILQKFHIFKNRWIFVSIISCFWNFMTCEHLSHTMIRPLRPL